jgi:hypothetical protein
MDDPIARLATMLRAIHERGYARVKCHQIWIYVPDPLTAPLAVFVGIWKQAGERNRRLRLLTMADDRKGARKLEVAEITTEHLGTGLRVMRYQAREKGQNEGPFLRAFLSYAFRVEEHQTDLQVFTVSDPHTLINANEGIEQFVRGIAVYRNTDSREPYREG